MGRLALAGTLVTGERTRYGVVPNRRNASRKTGFGFASVWVFVAVHTVDEPHLDVRHTFGHDAVRNAAQRHHHVHLGW